jgi:hypothetical protein
VVTSLEAEGQFSYKADTFLISFCISFAEGLKNKPLILNNAISVSIHNKLLINNLHSIILSIEVASDQENSAKAPRT